MDDCIQTYGHWSALAIECLNRQFKCNGCRFEQFFSEPRFQCKMKLSVLRIIKNIGYPDDYMPDTKLVDDSHADTENVSKLIQKNCENSFGAQAKFKPLVKLGIFHRRTK